MILLTAFSTRIEHPFSFSSQENQVLREGNETIKEQNEIIKQENDSLKQEMEICKQQNEKLTESVSEVCKVFFVV